MKIFFIFKTINLMWRTSKTSNNLKMGLPVVFDCLLYFVDFKKQLAKRAMPSPEATMTRFIQCKLCTMCTLSFIVLWFGAIGFYPYACWLRHRHSQLDITLTFPRCWKDPWECHWKANKMCNIGIAASYSRRIFFRAWAPYLADQFISNCLRLGFGRKEMYLLTSLHSCAATESFVVRSQPLNQWFVYNLASGKMCISSK